MFINTRKANKIESPEENLEIFFMPILSIVGSTKNQWPIIIEEKTDDTNKIGKKLDIKFWPIRLNEATANEAMLMKTKYFLTSFSKEYKNNIKKKTPNKEKVF